MAMTISLDIGTVFDTPYEKGCVVLSLPDQFGNFQGTDSEGVECEYNVVMISGWNVPDEQAAVIDSQLS